MKLLIADDEDTILQSVCKYIQTHCDRFSRVYTAENGQEAIDLALQHQPELLLLDMQMPLKNGIQVMQELHEAGLRPMTVVLSGYDEFRYAQQALKYGARDYLLKPARASDIARCLNRLADEYEGSQPDAGEQSHHLMSKIRNYIDEHYPQNLTLSSVAEEMGISGGYLSTLCHQNLDCGFVDYLNTVRVDRACAYLEQDYLKTYEIAHRVGFRDEKYFSKVFKKIKGMTPKEYRSARK